MEDGRGHHLRPRPDESIAALDHLEDHHAGVAALNEQRDAVAVLVLGEQLLQLARGGHVPAVDLENQVALLNPGLVGLAVGTHTDHDHAGLPVDVQVLGYLRRQVGNLQAVFALFFHLGLAGIGERQGPLGDLHVEGFLLAVADDRDFGGLAHRQGGGLGRQFAAVLDLLSIDRGDDVFGLDAGLIRRVAGDHVGHQHAFGLLRSVILSQIALEVLDVHPQPAAGDFAVFLELGDDLGGHVDRDGKPDALAVGDDGRVDAHHLAVQVQQRSAAVARVDGGVGLDEIVIGTGADDAALGADDAGRNGLLQAEGTADGHHPFADLQVRGAAQAGHGQVALGLDLDQGQVGLRIAADDLGLELALVLEFYLDVVGVFDDMVVGDDVTALVNDKPGADPALPALLGRYLLAERVHPKGVALKLTQAVPALGRLLNLDVHDRRAHLFCQGAEVVRDHPGYVRGSLQAGRG